MLEGYAVWVIVRKVTKRIPEEESYHISEQAKLIGETECWKDANETMLAMAHKGLGTLQWLNCKRNSPRGVPIEEIEALC